VATETEVLNYVEKEPIKVTVTRKSCFHLTQNPLSLGISKDKA